MVTILKLEELAQFLFGIFLFSQLDDSWWWFPTLLLLPDISMLGYLFNTKIGAVCYNIAHHKAIAIGLLLLGYALGDEVVSLAGVILFSHASMDRIFGFGLKYFDHFKHTHLGDLS
jgi:hypothetical protein